MASHSFHDCCSAILQSSSKAVDYAKSYAAPGLQSLPEHISGPVPESVRIQSLYLLANITHWRGEQASAVRRSLKEFSA